MLPFFTFIIVILYFFVAFLQKFQAKCPQIVQKTNTRRISLLALMLHGLVLFGFIYYDKNLSVSLLTSFIVWFIALLIYWVPLDKKSTQTLCILSFPICALSLLPVAFFHENPGFVHTYTVKETSHILLSTLTFSTIFMGAIQAGILSIQDRGLRKHRRTLNKRLPSVEAMEKFLFQTVLIGFLLLTLLLTTSILSFSGTFSININKIILSFSAWLVLAILLGGRFFFGWRGQTAIRWTFLETSLLLVIYFSSFLINS